MIETITSLLEQKLRDATMAHPRLQVILSNGRSIADVLKGTLTKADDIGSLAYQGAEPLPPDNEDGSYATGSPEWQHTYILTYRLGGNGLSAEDARLLGMAIAGYFSGRNTILVCDGITYTIRVQAMSAAPSPDLSAEQFDIPMTVGI